jgi:hypothetical protein
MLMGKTQAYSTVLYIQYDSYRIEVLYNVLYSIGYSGHCSLLGVCTIQYSVLYEGPYLQYSTVCTVQYIMCLPRQHSMARDDVTVQCVTVMC